MPSSEHTSSSLLLLLKPAQEAAAATRAPSGVRLLLPNATAHLAAEASMAAGLTLYRSNVQRTKVAQARAKKRDEADGKIE